MDLRQQSSLEPVPAMPMMLNDAHDENAHVNEMLEDSQTIFSNRDEYHESLCQCQRLRSESTDKRHENRRPELFDLAKQSSLVLFENKRRFCSKEHTVIRFASLKRKTSLRDRFGKNFR